MEVYVDVDEFEILREVAIEDLIDELDRRGQARDTNPFDEETQTKLAELMLYESPEETLAFLDKLLFPR
jgi:hypothetical protein